jgi:CelD/BcsL family acetyltransferase involved in cellulose biosynthesis
MQVSRVPIDDRAWREFTSTHPEATPFHLPAWAALIADCYRFQAFALTVQGSGGEILGGVPAVAVRFPLGGLRWVSLPFTDSCSVLARQGVAVEDVVIALERHAWASGISEMEVRSSLPAADGVYPVDVGYEHTVELPRDPADLHPQRNFRQHRNQARAKGVQVARSRDPEALASFYRLHTLTRRRLGVPVQPRRFFDLLSNRLLQPGSGFVATATLDGEVLAAAVYLVHNTTIVAKYQASDPDRRETGAGHLMHWEVMSAACAEGYGVYDLGRTDASTEGLRVFKTRMGAMERPLVYTHVGRRPPKEKGPAVGHVLQRAISKSPTWVCRLLGEVFYRWTA